MEPSSDIHFLKTWLESQSEHSFRALVERYGGLVYTTALRTCANESMAREASQLTFITLARKAASLVQRDSLGGWLHLTAMMQAKNLLQFRKREALKLERLGTYLQTCRPHHASNAWGSLAPVLDRALASLSDADREAIVLRYYRSQSVREIAADLTVSVDAAQKRLDRAMLRLRRYFGRHGVATSASLGAVLLAGFATDAKAASALSSSFAARALKSGAPAASSIVAGLLLALLGQKAALTVAVLCVVAAGVFGQSGRTRSSPLASVTAVPKPAATQPVTVESEARKKRLELIAKYGAERTSLSQTVTDRAMRITADTQELLLDRVVPAIESHRHLPLTAKLDPALDLSDQQRMQLGQLSAALLKRQIASDKETLEKIRSNPLPVMEVLLMGDACARGELPVEEYESSQAAISRELGVLENPIEAEEERMFQFGSLSPFDDETYMSGLREIMNPGQLETYVRATKEKIESRIAASAERRKFLNLSTMPPMSLDRLAKQAGGSLQMLEAFNP